MPRPVPHPHPSKNTPKEPCVAANGCLRATTDSTRRIIPSRRRRQHIQRLPAGTGRRPASPASRQWSGVYSLDLRPGRRRPTSPRPSSILRAAPTRPAFNRQSPSRTPRSNASHPPAAVQPQHGKRCDAASREATRATKSDAIPNTPTRSEARPRDPTQPDASSGQCKPARDRGQLAITAAHARDRITVRDALPARRRRSITFLASEHRRISRTLRDTCLTPAPYCV
jgi:hypothetical protein